MSTRNGIFEIKREGDTLILTPVTNLGELAYEGIESGAGDVLDLLNNSSVKNVVLDFHRTDYCGTTALGFFLKLWKRVRNRDGHLAFCNVSDHEREILQLTKLDHLWAICGSREEAMQAVRG
jgi:anti-anti-sigma factor